MQGKSFCKHKLNFLNFQISCIKNCSIYTSDFYTCNSNIIYLKLGAIMLMKLNAY